MTIGDVPLGLRLVRQAGWNQLEADWRRFLAMQPDGCFVGDLNGQARRYDRDLYPRPGGLDRDGAGGDKRPPQGQSPRRCLKHALGFLDRQGVKTIRLDATAAGQPVYEKLGFVPEYQLTRYQGIAPPIAAQPHVTPATANGFGEIIAFDQRLTGTPRDKMLSRLFAGVAPGLARSAHEGRLEGYVSVRRGANATQIGPCIATPRAGNALLGAALNRCAGRPVFIDIPCDNAPAVELAQASGLAAQRHFTRMCRGQPVRDNPQAIWASSGPEKG